MASSVKKFISWKIFFVANQAVHVRRSIIFPVAPARRYLMAPILGIVKDVLKTKNIINTEPKIKKETKAEKKINTKTKTNSNSYTVDMLSILLILSMLNWPFL